MNSLNGDMLCHFTPTFKKKLWGAQDYLQKDNNINSSILLVKHCDDEVTEAV